MRLLRRSAGEIVFLILAGKSAGAKQVLTFLLRRAGGGEGERWLRTKDTKRGNLRSRVRECVREGGRSTYSSPPRLLGKVET